MPQPIMYANTDDLKVLRADIADILPAGVVDWDTQMHLATEDVLERIKSEWFVRAVRDKYGVTDSQMGVGQIVGMFNADRLNSSALKNLTCYRAMSRYIYPQMTRDTDDGNDAFTRRADRYSQFYAEEWEHVCGLALYDFDGDAAFSDWERAPRVRTVRVRRA